MEAQHTAEVSSERINDLTSQAADLEQKLDDAEQRAASAASAAESQSRAMQVKPFPYRLLNLQPITEQF